MSLVLTGPSGKTISSLPDPNQSDDAEKAKQAKAVLSASRKELKSVLSMQKDRLYEALCTQREWRFEEWDTYLRKHPIIGRYCQRLVWAVKEGDQVKLSFRPLADGSLTSHQDEEVHVRRGSDHLPGSRRNPAAAGSQRLAAAFFRLQSGDAVPAVRQNHFLASGEHEGIGRDHGLRRPHGKGVLAQEPADPPRVHRGAAQDGGWFSDYHKTFARLGLEAVIEFTGNSLPEKIAPWPCSASILRARHQAKTHRLRRSDARRIAESLAFRVLERYSYGRGRRLGIRCRLGKANGDVK
jgi:hypothetical protein